MGKQVTRWGVYEAWDTGNLSGGEWLPLVAPALFASFDEAWEFAQVQEPSDASVHTCEVRKLTYEIDDLDDSDDSKVKPPLDPDKYADEDEPVIAWEVASKITRNPKPALNSSLE